MEEKQKRIYWNRNWQFLKGFEESYLGLQTIDTAQELEQINAIAGRASAYRAGGAAALF